jgi:hypothetical protein
VEITTFKLGNLNLLVSFWSQLSCKGGFLEGGEAFGAHLGDNLGEHLGKLLDLARSGDGESVGIRAGLNLKPMVFIFP